jgi:hypothetical protein
MPIRQPCIQTITSRRHVVIRTVDVLRTTCVLDEIKSDSRLPCTFTGNLIPDLRKNVNVNVKKTNGFDVNPDNYMLHMHVKLHKVRFIITTIDLLTIVLNPECDFV